MLSSDGPPRGDDNGLTAIVTELNTATVTRVLRTVSISDE
jgi:hypothetical protein